LICCKSKDQNCVKLAKKHFFLTLSSNQHLDLLVYYITGVPNFLKKYGVILMCQIFKLASSRDGSGAKIFDQGWVGSFLLLWSGQITHCLGPGNFPPKSQNRLGQKISGSKLDRPFIYCRSEVCLGRVKAHL